MYSKEFEEIVKAQEDLAKKIANFRMNNTTENLDILNNKNKELKTQNENLINEIKDLKLELDSLKNSNTPKENYNIIDKSLAINKALLNPKQCIKDLEQIENSLRHKIQNLKSELYKYSNESVYEIEYFLDLATQKLNNLSNVVNKNLELADEQINKEYKNINSKYSKVIQNAENTYKNTENTLNSNLNNNSKSSIFNNLEDDKTSSPSIATSNKHSIYDSDFKLSENETFNNKEKHKFEFKLGANVLNWIGVILLLLALITFGKYTYTNFLTVTMKGISLFIISTIILLLGEFIFAKKNEIFSQGIISLGIAGLYTSVIVNTIVLETMTSKTALVLAIVITIASILITNKHNSKVIAMLTLIGAYICLIPYSNLDTNSSYITFACYVLLNLGITSTNLFGKAIDNISKVCKTTVYVLGILSYIFIVRYVPNSTVYIFSILATALFNMMYIREYLSSFAIDILNFIIVSAISLLTYSQTIYYFNYDSMVISVAYIGIYIVLGILTKYFKKSKLVTLVSDEENADLLNSNKLLGNIYFIHSMFFFIFLTLNLKITIETSIIILSVFALLVFITAKLLEEDIFRYVSYVIFALPNILFFICGSQTTKLRVVLIVIALTFLIIDSLKNSEDAIVISFKYYTLIFILLNVFMELITRNISFKISITCVLYLLFVLYFIMDRVTMFTDQMISLFNPYFTLIIVLPVLVLTFNTFNIVSIALIALNIVSILIFSDRKALYTLVFLTYVGIFVFNDINVFVSSVFVMLLALCSIVIGFKLDEVITRKYGLILSLITCAKLFVYDVQGVSTLTRILLFFALGSIALGISYVYSTLEKKYKK